MRGPSKRLDSISSTATSHRKRKRLGESRVGARTKRLWLEPLEAREMLAPVIIPVPQNPADLSVPHHVYNGQLTVFKAIARNANPGISYLWTWDTNLDGNFNNDPFHFGTADAAGQIRDLSTPATLPLFSQDTLLNVGIKLERQDTGEAVYSTYPVHIYASPPPDDPRDWSAEQLGILRSIAIDDALWYLHTSMVPIGANTSTISGYVPGPDNNAYDPTPSAMLAFSANGRLPAYPPGTFNTYGLPMPPGWNAANDQRWNTDPYAEDLLRMFNWTVSRLSPTRVDAPAEQNDGRTPIPGTDDGWGVFAPNSQLGEAGQVGFAGAGLEAFASLLPVLGGTPVQVSGPLQCRTVEFVVQQMVDYLAYAQLGDGGWSYSPTGSQADSSASQWAFIGLEAADRAMGSYGVIVNDRVRLRLANIIFTSKAADGGAKLFGADTVGSFTPTAAMVGTAAWLGIDRFDVTDTTLAFPGYSNYTRGQLRQAFDGYVDYLDTHWTAPGQRDSRPWADGLWESGDYLQGSTSGLYNQGRGGNSYAIYSTQKGLRSLPVQPNVGPPADQQFDTYYIRAQYRSPSAPQGMILDDFNGATTPVLHNDLQGLWNTSLATQVLAPRPVPVIVATPDTAPINVTTGNAIVDLDASGSSHGSPGGTNVSFEWDLDWDGSYDDATGPDLDNQVFHFDTVPAGPVDKPIALRVTDDAGQSAVGTVTLHFQPPPTPPFADAAGPYVIEQGEGVTFDASGSFDPDEGLYQDFIRRVEWDLDNDGTFDYTFNDGTDPQNPATRTLPLSPADLQSFGLDQLRTPYTIRLRVTDAVGLTGTDTTTLIIYGNLPAAHAGGPYTGAEGNVIRLDGSGTVAGEPLSNLLFEWDLDYDGVTFNANTTGMQPTVTFPDDFATRPIALRVTDSGGERDTATTTITVTNEAPVKVLGPLVPGDLRPSVGDPDGSVIVAPVYEFVKEGLELLNQHEREEWGDNWCGPTAAGTSLGWFAEHGYPDLVPDTNGNGRVDESEKYEIIDTLGGLMGTDPDTGTTDKGFVDGLREFLDASGLGDSFNVKVFDADLDTSDPTFGDYSKELRDGEDVLVGLEWPGGGHWLTARSVSDSKNANGNHNVSFVDPWTGSVYDTEMKDDGSVLYDGQWRTFDIMVSVSPIEEGVPLLLNSLFALDAGVTDVLTGTVNWGDGTGTEALGLVPLRPGVWRIEAGHTYAQDGSYTASLTIRDDDGGVATYTRSINVLNVAPTVVVGPLVVGDLRPSVGDPDGSVIVAPVYEFVKEGLQLLDQHHDPAWGDNWCGPTAAGTSLGWFAEHGYPALVPDTNGNGRVDESEKYEIIDTLGGLMGTDPDTGTTDKGFVDGLREFLDASGLGDSFNVKVFDADLDTSDPTFGDYSKELRDGEDVLVGLEWPGGGHWLTARSVSDSKNANGNHNVSFVDPWTGTVYDTEMKDDGSVLYDGSWRTFDIMVSVSPIEEGVPLLLNSLFALDAGVQDVLTGTVSWGDGTSSEALGLVPLRPGVWRIEGGHTYANDGPYTASLTIRDDDGGVATYTRSINVLNVAPALEAKNNLVRLWVGETAENTGTWSDPGADLVTLASSLGTVTQNTNGTWNWSYATTAGPDWIRTVTITATDDDGGTSATTFQLAINPVVQLPGGRGTNSAVVSRNGDNIQVLNNKKLLFNEPEGSFQALKILGEANKSDTLTLDFSVGGPFVVSDRIVFDAGPGKYSDTLVLRGTAGADAFTLADFPVLVGNDPPLRIELGGTEHVTLDGGAGDDTYRVSNLSTKATIVDGKGNDVLDFSAATAGVNLNLTSTSPQRIFAPTNTNTLVLKGLFENVIGSPQADIIRGNSAANRIEGGAGNDTLYGNSGDDWLYGGTGDDWLYGGAGGDNLFGESGNNVLLGGAGNDVLDTLAGADAAGRNLLIGGPGADTLQGGPGEEILIGGTTSYDNRPAVLAAVMEQWASDQAFGERFDLLDRGFKDPAVGFIQFKRRGKQSPRGTVLDDGMRDSLFGGPGSDWFLDFPNDDVRDRTLPEDR